MKSKGRIYKKHFYQAKYVIKGKKLKTSTAVVKRESKKEEVTVIGSIADINSLFEKKESLSPILDIKKDEVVELETLDFDIEEIEIEPKKEVKENEKFCLYGDIAKLNTYFEEAKEEKEEKSLEKRLDKKTEEISKAYRQAEIKKETELAQKQPVNKMNETVGDKMVVKREEPKKILSEKEKQAEEERIRLLKLAREKKERLEQEKILKAKEKKAEKLNKLNKVNKVNNVRAVNTALSNDKNSKNNKVTSLDSAKKKRKNESKSFVIVAALLAIIIVAGIANIGKTMYDEIYKDKMLVGENEKKDEKKSLLDSIGLFKPNNTSDNVEDKEETNIEQKQVSPTDNPEQANGIGRQEIIVADGTRPNSSNDVVINENNLKDYLDNVNNNSNNNTGNNNNNNRNSSGSFDIYIPPIAPPQEGETGTNDPVVKDRYVEMPCSSSDFKLYKTNSDNVKKSDIKAGKLSEYRGYKLSGGMIKIPVADANGMWFVVTNGSISDQYAIDKENLIGVAQLNLYEKENGQDTLKEVIYAKLGTDVNLGGTYYTRDDEENEIQQYTTVTNAVGIMELYKK